MSVCCSFSTKWLLPNQPFKIDMAASDASWDPFEKEATCSICLEYFKDPVTLECGHNFCRDCVTKSWEKSGATETSCPQCREKVLQRNPRSNRQLANIVEITRKLSVHEPRRTEGQEGVCEKHQEPLKLFCKDDETSICLVCDKSKEHEDHRVIPMREAAEDYKDLMRSCQENLEKGIENILGYKAETKEECQDLLKRTEAEMAKLLREITEMHRFLERREKHFRDQMELLKKQIATKRDANFAIFDQELCSFKNLIQEMKEKCQQPPTELLQDVRSLLQRCEKKETFEKPEAFPPELKWKIWEFCDLNSGLADVMKQFRDNLLPGLELQKANVTLDPNTAGSCLVLSEDHKSVRFEAKCELMPDNPERFSYPTYVLGHEEFTTGRHFWEVAVGSEEEWSVGVAKKSVRRKGPVDIDPREGIWTVGKRIHSYSDSHPSSPVLPLSDKTKRVRVCLNCASNQVAFYDADTGDQIYVFSGVPFSEETILPFFYVYCKDPLEISP